MLLFIQYSLLAATFLSNWVDPWCFFPPLPRRSDRRASPPREHLPRTEAILLYRTVSTPACFSLFNFLLRPGHGTTPIIHPIRSAIHFQPYWESSTWRLCSQRIRKHVWRRIDGPRLMFPLDSSRNNTDRHYTGTVEYCSTNVVSLVVSSRLVSIEWMKSEKLAYQALLIYQYVVHLVG